MTASLLPIPDDPRFQRMIDNWPDLERVAPSAGIPYPRSRWLSNFEEALREFYPSANAASLKLTARHAAPFYLRDGHDVP